VPETAVNENGQLGFGENEVGLAKDWLVPTPTRQATCLQEANQAHFGGPVSRGPNLRHSEGTLFPCENVGHSLSLAGIARSWNRIAVLELLAQHPLTT